MKRKIFTGIGCLGISVMLSLLLAVPAAAQQLGTTDSNGTPYQHFTSREYVHIRAYSLIDGTYTFVVTEPSAATTLSMDDLSCRQVVVSGGKFTSVAPSGGCAHVTSPAGGGEIVVKL